MTRQTARLRIGIFMMLSMTLACDDAGDSAPGEPTTDIPATDEVTQTRRFFERNFVFASVASDSVFIVPWLIRTSQEPDSVIRDAGAWLARGGVWDGFFDERWRTGPTRAPTRLAPHKGLQFLVRDNGAIDGVIYEEGARSLELILGEANAPWTGAYGDTYQVLSGAAFLVDRRIDGMILDMSRASAGAVPPAGDWAFLLSGDSAYFVLAGDSEYGGTDEPSFRAWGVHEDERWQWSNVNVAWEETEAFPPARRDIPVKWRVSSRSGQIEGRLEAVSAEIQAGEGPGPLLPVEALFEVTGELAAGTATFRVHGVVVHERR